MIGQLTECYNVLANIFGGTQKNCHHKTHASCSGVLTEIDFHMTLQFYCHFFLPAWIADILARSSTRALSQHSPIEEEDEEELLLQLPRRRRSMRRIESKPLNQGIKLSKYEWNVRKESPSLVNDDDLNSRSIPWGVFFRV